MEGEASVPSPSVGLMVPGFILFLFLSFATIRGPSLISSDGIGSAVIVVAPLILATYALTVIVMAGRAGVDLSIGPLIGFINVGLIKLIEFGVLASPIAVFAYVIAVGVAYQLLMGLIIVYVRVQPIIVSLSGYLALVGLNLLILPRPGGVAPDWMMTWGAGTSIFSPVLVILVIATVAWYLMAQTAFFGHLRLMGSDERAAYTSGVKINVVRLGAHAIAGVYAGLAAICFTSLISSGDPTQGTTLTLMAVTALVLGGANLAGGRGGAIGSLLGALNIYLVTYLLATFNFGTVQSYVTDLSYGAMLVGSLLISSALPQLQRLARYVSTAVFFSLIASIGAGIILHATVDRHGQYATAAKTAAIATDAVVADATASAAGDAIVLVVIGIVGFGYIAGRLLRHPRPPMIAFAALIVVVALGLIFHPSGVDPAASTVVAAPADYSLDMLALGGVASAPLFDLRSSLLATLAFGLLIVLGVVLLASTIIRLNLIGSAPIGASGLRSALLPLAGLAPLALIAALAAGGGGASSLFGSEGLTFAAIGAALFVLMWSPLQRRIKNISSVYIVVLAAVAFGSLYFAGSPRGDSPPSPVEAASLSVLKPAGGPTSIVFAASPAPATSTDSGVAAQTRRVAYSLLIVFGLQFALWLAMRRGVRLRAAARFLPIVIAAAMGWGALFHLAAVSLSNVAVILIVAIVTAPVVWRAMGSFAGALARSGDLGGAAARR